MTVLWHPASATIVLPKEKLCLLGWPLFPEAAAVAGIVPFEFPLVRRGGKFAGNAYHVGVMGAIMATALSCVKLID
jgi:hypothetical protein